MEVARPVVPPGEEARPRDGSGAPRRPGPSPAGGPAAARSGSGRRGSRRGPRRVVDVARRRGPRCSRRRSPSARPGRRLREPLVQPVEPVELLLVELASRPRGRWARRCSRPGRRRRWRPRSGRHHRSSRRRSARPTPISSRPTRDAIRHPVPLPQPVVGDLVAELAEGEERHRLVGELGLLEAEDVRLLGRRPGQRPDRAGPSAS